MTIYAHTIYNLGAKQLVLERGDAAVSSPQEQKKRLAMSISYMRKMLRRSSAEEQIPRRVSTFAVDRLSHAILQQR
jgi:hypothetical protein